MTNSDRDRIRSVYADRARRFSGSDIYSLFNQANLFTLQQRQRDMLTLLRKNGFYPLGEYSILELGCGKGGVLLELLAYGARPDCLHGTDLLPDRIEQAYNRLSHIALTCADGQSLPYSDNAFDLVLQYTVFTSVLDDGIKANLVREMLRVLRPQGMILWYDFWLNPSNPQAKGIRPSEIRKLFPTCKFDFHRITLAPPLARYLVPISWTLAFLLEKIRIFNSHYLIAIHPKPKKLSK